MSQIIGGRDITVITDTGLNHRLILRAELIIVCIILLTSSLFVANAYAGCMSTSATVCHVCFENLDDRRLSETTGSNFDLMCGDECLKILYQDLCVPTLGSFDDLSHGGMTENKIRAAYNKGVMYGYHLVAKVEERERKKYNVF